MITTRPVGRSRTVRAVRRRGARREAVVTLVLVLLLLGAALVGVSVGQASVSLPELVDLLTGRADQVTRFVLIELRLPRLLTAVVTGACLGLSGALLQTIVRNPLASPDIVGITHSASAAGVLGVVYLGLSGLALAGFVSLGALAAATAIYLLAWRQGVAGYRLLLIGIGVAALSTSVTSWVLTQSDVRDARVALTWITGSLARSDWPTLNPLLGCFAVLVVALVLLGGRLRSLELGDDSATSLGVPAERSRLWLLLTSVALAASAVAVAGPVAFVALVSAPIARRTVGAGRLALLPAALIGAIIMLASDLLAQFTIPGIILPVGVVTGIVGAPYLLWLLMRTNRSGAGG
ncbi:iron complex transport system permease protein [Nocardiopsis sp. Huas11]|uniref:FecCD family ABC transporter permease n=1 Tax=Nocardiopsis sp. Huas11 TaxID=2183912 RepID=UPI000F13A66E|nr:iron chelate uptake ABC transporter family permease subunit [Nocardiopsis sp. Huas11]RKS07224.1 iron complex transport system permease protein [Nocardiopsis sp. Huas11]